MRVVVWDRVYVGLPLAMRAVEVGHDVVSFEIDDSRVKSRAAGESYVEYIPITQLAAALASGRYLPTADEAALAGFDVAVITLPTPSPRATPTCRSSRTRLRPRPAPPGPATVILESTTYPGATEELLATILEQGSASSPAPASTSATAPNVLIWQSHLGPGQHSQGGVRAGSRFARAVKGFYDTIVDTTVPVSWPKEGELAKLLVTPSGDL